MIIGMIIGMIYFATPYNNAQLDTEEKTDESEFVLYSVLLLSVHMNLGVFWAFKPDEDDGIL